MKSTLKHFFTPTPNWKTRLVWGCTRYRPRYIRSLVYMAQASEYRAHDYLRWFWRTRDFLRVEQRKSLVKTPKALLFWAVLLVSTAILYTFAIWALLVGTVWWRYFVALLMVIGTPFAIAYGLAGLLIAWELIQWPIESLVMRHAKRLLAAHKGLKIAVAGSFGKTTMREILKTVLSAGLPAEALAKAGKKVTAPPASYNTPLGISSFIRKLKGDEDVLIFEFGEYYPGDIKRLCHLVQPDIGVITGVNEAHLEKFKSLSRTRKTIFELADYLGDKPLYINGENELAVSPILPFLKEVSESSLPAEASAQAGRTEDLSPLTKGAQPVFGRGLSSRILYSRSGAGSWTVERAQTSLSGTSFTLRSKEGDISVRSRLLGLHHVGPLTAAADLALRIGLKLEEIEQGISATKPFDHRLEPKEDGQGIVWLDDSYNGNPDGVRAVIEFLGSLKGVRRWYVTPGLVEMGPRKEEVHKEIGRHLARAGIERVILIRNSVTSHIAQGLQEEGYSGEVMWFDKALDTFAALPNLTVKGDVVLLQNDWPDQYS